MAGKKVASKTLILIRHAHRDKDQGRQADNGLSRKGQRQAERLAGYFREIYRGQSPYVMSSPKRRCVETVFPIARAEKTEVQISTLLDEHQESPKPESSGAFEARVARFCEWWSSPEAPPLVLACSHGDWIPLAFQTLIGTAIDLDKGAWAELILEQGTPRLRWLLQDFKR